MTTALLFYLSLFVAIKVFQRLLKPSHVRPRQSLPLFDDLKDGKLNKTDFATFDSVDATDKRH